MSMDQVRGELKGIGGKAWRQIQRTTSHCRRSGGRREGCEAFNRTLTADFTANLIRNVWSYAIIFCGHFPDQTYTFTEDETDGETRGAWYVRQLIGAANIDGWAGLPRDQRQPRLPGRAPPVP